MRKISTSRQSSYVSCETSTFDANGNVYKEPKDLSCEKNHEIVESSDNFIARFFYSSKIGFFVNLTLLISWTLYYTLTISDKLKDDYYREKIFEASCLPFVKQLFFFTLPLDILMMTLILGVLYPLSRLSRSTVYYWIIGLACSAAMFTIICIELDSITFAIRLLTVVDATRLSMKVCAFLLECHWNEEVFNKSSHQSLLYYLLIPHLIYQHEYPRAPKVRWIKALCHLWWILVAMFSIYSLHIEYFTSTIFDPMTVSIGDFTWRLLKLGISVGVSYIFVVWFLIFENFNGLHGELLRFPDLRLFDIRNLFNGSQLATEINIIVSKWLSRYVFIPTIKATDSRFLALFVTLSVSFIFHEICILYILHVTIPLACLAIMIFGSALLSLRIKNIFASILLGLIIMISVLFWAGLYPVEYIAWNFSSMSGIQDESKVRLIPLFWKQLTITASP